MKPPLKLYYNTDTDALGISGDGWNYICLCKHVPFVRTTARAVFEDGADPIAFVPHEIAESLSDLWVEIGEF